MQIRTAIGIKNNQLDKKGDEQFIKQKHENYIPSMTNIIFG
jgi:hypothetical protein